jgi:hypothetical protein
MALTVNPVITLGPAKGHVSGMAPQEMAKFTVNIWIGS